AQPRRHRCRRRRAPRGVLVRGARAEDGRGPDPPPPARRRHHDAGGARAAARPGRPAGRRRAAAGRDLDGARRPGGRRVLPALAQGAGGL
ncbi:MAG: hypothetical protein AVDCRST_MAG35-1405, partial [uncultured Quadrisphaera sp.]